MKKLLWALTYTIITGAVLVLLNACKHEYEHTKCEPGTVELTLSKTDANLNKSDGSITATATGGEKIQYKLNNNPFQSSGIFLNLPSGNYTVIAKNEFGCTDTASISIGIIDPCAGKVVKIDITKTDATLNQSNGSITATASGGTNFTYSLNNGAFQSSGVFNNLKAGTYTVMAKSSEGCIGTVQVTIGSSDPCTGITVSVTTTKVDPTFGQSNGSITATASGGTGFTYSLNNGTFQTSGTFNNLSAGNYTVTAKNSNGCIGVAQVTLGSTNPCTGTTVSVVLTKTDPQLNQTNGSITVTASGGTGFTYSLNNGAYQSSNVFNNLGAGTYIVSAKNSTGCVGSAQITLTGIDICSSTIININTSIINLLPCSTPANNGSITVTATGSTGFVYNINNGLYQSSNLFNNLAAATYTVGVKDANGCIKTTTAVVGTQAPGPLFSNVKTLISTRCAGSPCHTNGGNAAGYNFDNQCNIVTYWSQIYGSAVTYTLKQMPLGTLLSASEKQIITDWVNAGHVYNK
ncbi:MAG TPA: hypothetical protein VFN30_15065 [Chitinophagaceae bacterium]|nr:hypothetical protein [Chitinophagaceae bacterium]